MALALIASTTLSSSQSSVSFSSISSAYKDLMIIASVRSDLASANSSWTIGTNISGTWHYTFWRATGATRQGGFTSDSVWGGILYNPASTSTADAFSNQMICLPSYSKTNIYKLGWHASAMGTFTGNLYMAGGVGEIPSNTAISSITITEANSSTFTANSTFYLYGIS